MTTPSRLAYILFFENSSNLVIPMQPDMRGTCHDGSILRTIAHLLSTKRRRLSGYTTSYNVHQSIFCLSVALEPNAQVKLGVSCLASILHKCVSSKHASKGKYHINRLAISFDGNEEPAWGVIQCSFDMEHFIISEVNQFCIMQTSAMLFTCPNTCIIIMPHQDLIKDNAHAVALLVIVWV